MVMLTSITIQLKAQKNFKFKSTAQQINHYDSFYNVVDTVSTSDTVIVELNPKKNILKLMYKDPSKNTAYNTTGCGKIDGSYACTLKDQSWGSLVQFQDAEILFVLTEKMEVRFKSLTKLETGK
jgi:hypothetical protein